MDHKSEPETAEEYWARLRENLEGLDERFPRGRTKVTFRFDFRKAYQEARQGGMSISEATRESWRQYRAFRANYP